MQKMAHGLPRVLGSVRPWRRSRHQGSSTEAGLGSTQCLLDRSNPGSEKAGWPTH